MARVALGIKTTGKGRIGNDKSLLKSVRDIRPFTSGTTTTDESAHVHLSRGGDRMDWSSGRGESYALHRTSSAASAAGNCGTVSLISGCGQLGTCAVGLDWVFLSTAGRRSKPALSASSVVVYPQQLGSKIFLIKYDSGNNLLFKLSRFSL